MSNVTIETSVSHKKPGISPFSEVLRHFELLLITWYMIWL